MNGRHARAALGLGLAIGALAHAAPAAAAGTSLGDGAWSYFGDPRAVHANGRTYLGWVTSTGRIQVASVDSERRVTTRTIDWLGPDDHNNPSVFVRGDGRIVALYAPHRPEYLPVSRRHKLYFRISTRPHDVRDWGPVRRLPANTPKLPGRTDRGFTYPNPVQMRSGNVWLFWRGGSWWPSVSYTRDWSRWARPRHVVRALPGQRPYVKYAGDGRSVAMAFTECHPGSLNSSIYFLRVFEGGGVHRADGTKLGTLDRPPHFRRADVVYRYSAQHGRSWIMDVAIGADRRPVVLYFRREAFGGDTFRYARWDGRAWVDRPVVAAGPSPFSGYYVGGATLDHEDPRIVYLSRRPDRRSRMEIETWATADDGVTWASAQVTSGSDNHNWRPVSPRGHPGSRLFWFTGRYVQFTSYKTRVLLEDARRRARLGAPRAASSGTIVPSAAQPASPPDCPGGD